MRRSPTRAIANNAPNSSTPESAGNTPTASLRLRRALGPLRRLDLTLDRQQAEQPVHESVPAGCFGVVRETDLAAFHILADPDELAAGRADEPVAPAWRHERGDAAGNGFSQRGAVDQHADLRVDGDRARVEVQRADEHALPIDDKRLRVE